MSFSEIRLDFAAKNAMSSELMGWLRGELDKAGGRPVLLTGTGNAFSAGLNLKEVGSLDPPGMKRFIQLLEDLVLDLFEYPGPTVAWVNGHAIAGGCVMALCCDHRVATSDEATRIGLNEVALGLRFPPRVLELGRTVIPQHHLEEVMLGAGLFAPERARSLGLVHELGDRALAVARLEALAAHPPDAYASTKLALRQGLLDAGGEQARSEFERESLPVWTSGAIKERIRAHLKR